MWSVVVAPVVAGSEYPWPSMSPATAMPLLFTMVNVMFGAVADELGAAGALDVTGAAELV